MPPHLLAPRSTTSPCHLRKRHVPPTRTCSTNPPLLITSTRPRNPLRPWSFPTVLMSQLILACGTATSQPPLCLAQINFYRATSATWPACYNTWHAFSNSEVWKVVTAQYPPTGTIWRISLGVHIRDLRIWLGPAPFNQKHHYP